ncbi:zinc-ribbon domain-containing protein [Maridesulfovibrio sp.]|uniref:zinc-ribbon domain-containing protein n=1 Tax=Maridesulfovibrio sp. TaxID=2795000 RepID=UPI002A18B5BE|nr:zinc-ribbon domain-containing protein [Maridesulfovibrio sp.]
MKVTCPECNFSSEIPEEKIPANAQLATCPKCGIKFQFRELHPADDSSAGDIENSPYTTEDEVHENTYAQDAYREEQYTSPADSSEQQYDAEYSTTPDETETPYTETEDRVEPSQSRSIGAENLQNDEKADIWQKLDSMSPENGAAEEKAPGSTPKGTEVPFEHLETYGFFPGIFLTIKKILLSPASFFTDMELTGFIKPLIFFILLAEFQEICNFIWATAGVDSAVTSDVSRMVGDSVIAESLRDGTASALFSLLLYPLMLAALSFPLIGFTHVMLMIFGAGERGYQATFRATTYSYAPIIFCVIPIAGNMIGAVASAAISIIAYKNIHKTSYLRVVLSMVMPIVLLLVILGFYMNFNQPTI